MMWMLCPAGCHHAEPVNLEDSREGFVRMVAHLSDGTHGGRTFSRRDARDLARRSCVVGEYYLRTRFETNCEALYDHEPHGDRIQGCYGAGPFRRVPPLTRTEA